MTTAIKGNKIRKRKKLEIPKTKLQFPFCSSPIAPKKSVRCVYILCSFFAKGWKKKNFLLPSHFIYISLDFSVDSHKTDLFRSTAWRFFFFFSYLKKNRKTDIACINFSLVEEKKKFRLTNQKIEIFFSRYKETRVTVVLKFLAFSSVGRRWRHHRHGDRITETRASSAAAKWVEEVLRLFCRWSRDAWRPDALKE